MNSQQQINASPEFKIQPAFSDFYSVKVIVPTLNAAQDWALFAPALLSCGIEPKQVLVLDSESTDGTADLATAAGFEVLCIRRTDFNHGGTRQIAVDKFVDATILIYLTQDAVIADPESLRALVSAFDDPLVAAAYGRQLPRPKAAPIEAHARLFNYSEKSEVRSLESRKRLGIKTAFLSNSFAAYRHSALVEVGGFPSDVLFGEDTLTAAKLLLSGYKVAYVAEACVYHSHSYTLVQEFRRYFDIGVLHTRESWLIDEFGKVANEGNQFVLSQFRYLKQVAPLQIPLALVSSGVKLLAYKLGRRESLLSRSMKRRLSMHPSFWRN
jgi:rhamnosyltransferase